MKQESLEGSNECELGGFSPFDPGVDRPLHEVSRREARKAFALLMDARASRLDELGRLLQSNGVKLSDDDDGIGALNRWFNSEVKGDATTVRLEPWWYAVVNDIGLFLGEVMIRRCPHLEWRMYEWGKSNLSYQRHVIMGFTQVANPHYNIDPDVVVATTGHRVVIGESVANDDFLEMVRRAQELA